MARFAGFSATPFRGVFSYSFYMALMSAFGGYCCKSLFALVIKNPPGCRRDFRVKMWGTSAPDDKLTGDLGSIIETTQIGGRRSDRLMAGNYRGAILDFYNSICQKRKSAI